MSGFTSLLHPDKTKIVLSVLIMFTTDIMRNCFTVRHGSVGYGSLTEFGVRRNLLF